MEDGDAVIHLGLSEVVMRNAVANNVFAGDVSAVVVQRDVERVFGSDLIDIPRWHYSTSVELFLRGDFTVVTEELTNGSPMGSICVLTRVWSAATIPAFAGTRNS